MKVVNGSVLLLIVAVLPWTRLAADTITIDENGNGVGTIGKGFLSLDPGPGGFANVLTYNLPFVGVQGDVVLNEPGDGGGDIIRFNGNSTVIFYSQPPIDSLADKNAPPGGVYTNITSIAEGANGIAVYTPKTGQPGFDSSNPTFDFVSDPSAVPEPASVSLLMTAVLLTGIAARKRSGGRRILARWHARSFAGMRQNFRLVRKNHG